MYRRLRKVWDAYQWMLTHHPDLEYGMMFVLEARKHQTDNLHHELRRWKHARSHR